MSFASSWAFYLFIPLAAIVLSRIFARRSKGLRYSSLSAVKAAGKSFRQRMLWIVPVLEIAAAATMICALARPREEISRSDRVIHGVAIEMVMDISSSMTITMRNSSEHASRLNVAKQCFEQFVAGNGDNMPGRPNDLIGLTTFARYPNTVCPLTRSHNILLYFVRRLQIEERPNEDGTAFGDAVALAAARLETVEDRMEKADGHDFSKYKIRSKVIVLLTDGDNNCGRHLPLAAAAMARKWGVRIYTIGFNETGNAALDDSESSATEKTLRQMAEMTGGSYRRAYDPKSLESVYAEINRMEQTLFEDKPYIDYEERYQPFAAVGIILFVLAVALKHTRLRLVR